MVMVVLLVPGLFLVQTTNVNNHDVYANNNWKQDGQREVAIPGCSLASTPENQNPPEP